MNFPLSPVSEVTGMPDGLLCCPVLTVLSLLPPMLPALLGAGLQLLSFKRSQSPGTWTPTPEHLSTALVQSRIASQVCLVCVVLLPASLLSRWVSVAVHSRCRTFPFPPASFPIYTCCCHTAHLGES